MSQQINLFNPHLLKQKKYFSVLTMAQALGLILLGSIFFYLYAIYQVKQLTAQSEDTAKRYRAAEARLVQYSSELSPQQAKQMLEYELKQSETLLAEQRELIDTLKSGALGNTSGFADYMRAFARQTISGLWLTGFEITGDATQMTMRGSALNPELLPLYIKRLNHEKIMRGKEFASLQMQQHKFEDGKPVNRNYLDFILHSAELSEAKK